MRRRVARDCEPLGDTQVLIARLQVLCEHRHDIVDRAGYFGGLLGQVADRELVISGLRRRQSRRDQRPMADRPAMPSTST